MPGLPESGKRKRKTVSDWIQKAVLTECRRRCAICFGLHRDDSVKAGQIAHLDRDPKNGAVENLIYLCLDHHHEYDSVSRQAKGFFAEEVLFYKRELSHTLPPGCRSLPKFKRA